jgi:hypothetical protein
MAGMPDDTGKGVGDALTSLGSALTSPAKLAFAGLVLLVYKGALGGFSFWKFALIAVLFVALQVYHDDYLRIVLNRWAHHSADKRGWPSQDGK